MALFDVGILITAINQSAGAFRQVNSDLDQTNRKAQQTTNGLRAIQVVLASIAITKISAFAKEITDVVGDMQQLVVRLSQVSGGLAEGIEQFNDIQKRLSGSGFDLKPIVDGIVKLRNAGLSLEDAKKTVLATVDAVAALGGSNAELERALTAIGQIGSKQQLMAEELKQQLAESIPSAIRIVAKELGMSISQLTIAMSKGEVDGVEAIRALTRGFEKEYGNMASKLRDTVKGSFSAIFIDAKTAIENALDIKTDASARLTVLFQNISKQVSAFINSIDQAKVDAFFKGLQNLANVAVPVIVALGNIAGAALDLVNKIASLLNGQDALLGGATYGFVGALLFGKNKLVGAAIGALIGFVGQITGVFSNMSSGVRSILASLGKAAEFGMLGLLVFGPMGAAFIAAVAFLVDQVIKLFSGKLNDFKKQAGDIVSGAAGDTLGNAVGNVTNNLAGIIKKGFDNSSKVSGGKGSFIDSLFGSQADVDKVKQQIKDLAGTNGVGQIPYGLSTAGAKAMQQLQTLAQQAGVALDGAGLPFEATVARLSNKLQTISNQFSIDNKKLTELNGKIAAGTATDQDRQQAKALQDELGKAQLLIAAIKKTIGGFAGESAAQIRDKITDAVDTLTDKLDVLREKFGGTLESAEVAKVEQEFNKIVQDLQNRLVLAQKLNAATGADSSLIAQINDQLAQANALKAKALEVTKSEFGLKQQIFILQQQANRLDAQSQILNLQKETRSGAQILFSSDLSDQVQQRKIELQQQMMGIQEKILNLQLQRARATDEEKGQIDDTIAKLNELKGVTAEAMQNTTEYAMLSREFWTSVRDSISDVLSNGLNDLITGTKSAKDVLLDFYNSITKAAVNYLAKLVEVYLQQQLLGALGGASGGGAGGVLGFLGGLFANGGAFKGGVKPFARGDIIGGPTLFGIAGEKGEEAILPLTRIGGRLGVQARGGSGGDHYHITIQAIDAQSSQQWINNNRDAFVGTMRHARRVNNGLDKSR